MALQDSHSYKLGALEGLVRSLLISCDRETLLELARRVDYPEDEIDTRLMKVARLRK